ncbi:MAG: hypothetical protein NTY35_07180 [Planctomycetota bacterium]|nr:hypothetical protein [Planctomycetota bacterium]
MLRRILALARAGFAHHVAGGAIPVAPLVVHGSVGALAALLVRDSLGPFPFALAILSLSAALVALPLLGDLAPLLRADPSEEWIAAQPVTQREIRLARSLVAIVVVAGLAASSLIPAAIFAPHGWSFVDRATLVVAGLGLALTLAAGLLTALSVLGGRAEGALVLLQTLLFAAIVVGALVGLRSVPELARIARPEDAPAWLAWLPSTWFARALAGSWWPAIVASFAALTLLVAAPAAPAPSALRRGALSFVLAPLHAFAARTWVRREERASFELVARLLPLERDVILRTYPLVGIPLAFLAAGARSGGPEREALLALLLFAPPVWMPILLAHVPASASHAARWLLDGAPIDHAALHAGARKAIAVRFLFPLYAALFVLAAWQAGPGFAVRLVVPAALLAWLLIEPIYDTYVRDLPLSRSPDDLLVEMDWTGPMIALGAVQVVAAVAAWKFLAAWPAAIGVSVVLLAYAWVRERRARASSTRAQGAQGA